MSGFIPFFSFLRIRGSLLFACLGDVCCFLHEAQALALSPSPIVSIVVPFFGEPNFWLGSYTWKVWPSKKGTTMETTHRHQSSSFLGFPYRILNMNTQKELLWGLWVDAILNPKPLALCRKLSSLNPQRPPP